MAECMACFETKAAKFCWIFRYILRSMAKEITFLKGNLCILYILYIFVFGAREN